MEELKVKTNFKKSAIQYETNNKQQQIPSPWSIQCIVHLGNNFSIHLIFGDSSWIQWFTNPNTYFFLYSGNKPQLEV